MFQKAVIIVALLMTALPASAQNWSGIIDPSRAIDWSNKGANIQARSTQCGATIAAYSGSAATINSAITACPANQFVLLGPGTFTLSSGITFGGKNNVTLRGAGANSTFLVFTGSVSCSGLASDICLFNGTTSSSASTNWTAGFSVGTTQITVASVSGISVGSLIILDQNNDTSDGGFVYVCEAMSTCSSEGPSGAGRSGRTQTQLVSVTNIAGTVLTISPGVYMPNWRSGQSPQVYLFGTAPITGDGIENLSMDHTGSNLTSGVNFFNAYNCWLKGVRSIDSNRNHVWFFQSARITVRDSYFFLTKNAASQSYGIEPFISSDNLVENNIFQQIAAPVTVNGSCSGCVFGYNYSINNANGGGSTMFAGAWLHSAGVDNELFEGNIGAAFFGDSIHGTHHFITLFRNYEVGWEQGKTSQTFPIFQGFGSRMFNQIGNVLGRNAYHTTYQASSDTAIYAYMGAPFTSLPNDPNVLTTLMRWGNYDTVNAAVRFLSSEVPSGIAQFANPVPASQTLPPSFYLNAKPAWFPSATSWPPIGPDVTGGTVDGNNGSNVWTAQTVGGHANDIPALNCYKNTMAGAANGTGSVLAFDASVCYAGTSQAATPSCLPGAGTYGMPQFVTCTDSSSGAIMCYTTDGTTPATNGTTGCTTGTLYSGAITIAVAETLKVIAGGTGFLDSAVLSNIYISGPAPAPAIFAGFMGNVSGQIFRPN